MDPRFLSYIAQQSVETTSPAEPAAAPATGQGGLLNALYMPAMLIGLIAFMYFFSIRPSRKEEKRKKDMMGSLKKGDTVITAAGIIGSIHSIKDDTVILKVGDNARIEMLRSAIQDVRSRSSEKAEKSEKEEKK